MYSPKELIDILTQSYDCLSEKKFQRFSEESINFFDEYPHDPSIATEWWISKGSNLENGIYQNYLKPEFEALIQDLIETISIVDVSIQTDARQCVSRPNSQGHTRRYVPYYWGAIHYAKGKTSKKSLEIQFFLNLTKIGLRVGIYYGKQKDNTHQWNAFAKRLRNKSEEVTEELIQLIQEKSYHLVRTQDQDHAMGRIGTKLPVNNSEELLDNTIDYPWKKEFTLLKTIPRERLESRELVYEIIEIFVETRKIYEILESSNKMKKIRRLRTG